MISGRDRCRLHLPFSHLGGIALVSIGWDNGGKIVKTTDPTDAYSMIMGLQTSGIVAIDPLGRKVLPADSWLAAQGAF